MNLITLVGQVYDAPYFNRVGHRKQPFMSLRLRVPGPAQEGPTLARVAVYGKDAETYFPQLRPGTWVAICGRYRVRTNANAEEQLRTQFTDLLYQKGITGTAALVRALVDAVRVPVSNIHEFVALRGQIRLIPIPRPEDTDAASIEA